MMLTYWRPAVTEPTWRVTGGGISAMFSLAMLLGVSAHLAAQDDSGDDAPAEDAQQVAQFEVQENQFEQWVFQNLQTVAAARSKLEQSLTLQTEDVDQACRLSEAQKKKLQLAGRGDMKRFFDRVEVVRQKFLLVRKDQQRFNDIWQDIQPLQTEFNDGLFGDDSIFRKTLRNTLDQPQWEQYARIHGERLAFRFRAKVELTVAMLENAVPLRDEQRQKLIALIVAETPLPRRFGQYDYYLLLWNISKLPDEKLKPIFDATQWKVLKQQLAQGRGMEQWLKQSGMLPKEDEAGEHEPDEKPKGGDSL